MKKWYLVIDVEKCENCQNCFLACRDEHVNNAWPGYSLPQLDHGQPWIRIRTKERGQFPLIDVAYLAEPCMHCDGAPCIRAGTGGAVHKRPDGIVIIDPVRAKGRKELVAACPYGAIEWNEELEVAQKCTLCAHLLDDGWTKTRCVQSCPTGALRLRHAEDGEMEEAIRSEKLEVYLPELRTRPRAYYKNLHRFSRCFIAATVAVRVEGKEECAEGAQVTLFGPSGDRVGEAMTDNYGDFKFDNLTEHSGTYRIQIDFPGHDRRSVECDLEKSTSLGVILL